MRGHRPQVPGLHVAECTRVQSDNNNMSTSDVRVRSTQIGVPEWKYHHRVEVEYNGAYGWRHNGIEHYCKSYYVKYLLYLLSILYIYWMYIT